MWFMYFSVICRKWKWKCTLACHISVNWSSFSSQICWFLLKAVIIRDKEGREKDFTHFYHHFLLFGSKNKVCGTFFIVCGFACGYGALYEISLKIQYNTFLSSHCCFFFTKTSLNQVSDLHNVYDLLQDQSWSPRCDLYTFRWFVESESESAPLAWCHIQSINQVFTSQTCWFLLKAFIIRDIEGREKDFTHFYHYFFSFRKQKQGLRYFFYSLWFCLWVWRTMRKQS